MIDFRQVHLRLHRVCPPLELAFLHFSKLSMISSTALVPIAVIGGLVSFVAQQVLFLVIRKANTTAIHTPIPNHSSQNKEESLSPSRHQTLNILTYNIAGLPTYCNTNPPLKRISLLGKILASDESIDVIVFQEAFDFAVIDILKTKLTANFPYIVENPLPNLIFASQGSGLFVASKFPITWVESHYFGDSIGSDFFAAKGVVGVGVDVGGEREVQVFTTHTQADMNRGDPLFAFVAGDRDARARRCRAKQFEVMRTFINDRRLSTSNLVGQIIAGDFNVVGERLERVTPEDFRRSDNDQYFAYMTDEYEDVRQHFHRFEDVFRKFNPCLVEHTMLRRDLGLTTDGSMNADVVEWSDEKRLDYIFAWGENLRSIFIEVRQYWWRTDHKVSLEVEHIEHTEASTSNVVKKGKHMSDHMALYASFSL